MSLEGHLRDLEALTQRQGPSPAARARGAAIGDGSPLSPASEANGAAVGQIATVPDSKGEDSSIRRDASEQDGAGGEQVAAAVDEAVASAVGRVAAQVQAEQRWNAALCAGLRRRAARIRALRGKLQEVGVEVPEAPEDSPALAEGEEEAGSGGDERLGVHPQRGAAGAGDGGGAGIGVRSCSATTAARRLLAAASSTQRYPLDAAAADAAAAAVGGDPDPACAALLEAAARFDALRRENGVRPSSDSCCCGARGGAQ